MVVFVQIGGLESIWRGQIKLILITQVFLIQWCAMTAELRDGPFQLWEDFEGLFKNGTNYCLLMNDKIGYPVGLIVKGFDKTFGVERIMAIPLNRNGYIGRNQMLFEFWTEGIHGGQLAISKVESGDEFKKLDLFLGYNVNVADHLDRWGNTISGYIAGLKDETWRSIARGVLTRSGAKTLYRKWFL